MDLKNFEIYEKKTNHCSRSYWEQIVLQKYDFVLSVYIITLLGINSFILRLIVAYCSTNSFREHFLLLLLLKESE